MQPILDRLRLRDGDEEESRQTIRRGSNLELIGVVVDDDPVERLPPPPSEAARIPCIDDCLLPLEAHESIVEAAWPACRTTPGPGDIQRWTSKPSAPRRLPLAAVTRQWSKGVNAIIPQVTQRSAGRWSPLTITFCRLPRLSPGSLHHRCCQDNPMKRKPGTVPLTRSRPGTIRPPHPGHVIGSRIARTVSGRSPPDCDRAAPCKPHFARHSA